MLRAGTVHAMECSADLIQWSHMRTFQVVVRHIDPETCTWTELDKLTMQANYAFEASDKVWNDLRNEGFILHEICLDIWSL